MGVIVYDYNQQILFNNKANYNRSCELVFHMDHCYLLLEKVPKIKPITKLYLKSEFEEMKEKYPECITWQKNHQEIIY